MKIFSAGSLPDPWRQISHAQGDREIPQFEIFVSFARALHQINPGTSVIGTV